jgi:hypothetical protein
MTKTLLAQEGMYLRGRPTSTAARLKAYINVVVTTLFSSLRIYIYHHIELFHNFAIFFYLPQDMLLMLGSTAFIVSPSERWQSEILLFSHFWSD